MISVLEAHISTHSSNVVEIGEWGSRATLDIVGAAGMGQDFDALSNPSNPLTKIYQQIFKPSKEQRLLGLLGLFIPPRFIGYLPVRRNADIFAASKVARDTCRSLIERKKVQLSNKEALPPDIVSTALESGAFTEENLVDQMMTFLAAGHETTSSSIQWAVYLLALHPDIQTRLRNEIRASIPSPSSESSIDSQAIDRVTYLHAVCSEVLRVYPPVPLTLRIAAHNTTIGTQPIPKGTVVILAPAAINTSPQLWGSDAAQFNPSRWLDSTDKSHLNNSGGATSNYAFMTFLHGPRSCIGQRFAVSEFACLLAALCGRFEWELANPEEEITIKGGITARPRNGMNIKMKVVEGW